MEITKERLDELKNKLIESRELDTEVGHVTADNILCELLTELGYSEIVDLYDKVDKWYA